MSFMIKVGSAIEYVGVDDLNIDLFEGQYVVPNGMSYNSYLILDEKIAIMDCADCRVVEEWFDRLKSALNERRPSYLVVHHMEPDHSAGIERIVKEYPDVTIVASAKALQMLSQFFGEALQDVKQMAVKEGDRLSLGSHTLQFIAAPMIHWPEVMMSYEESEHVLFSADAFGKFGALSADEDWACEARRYYFNIVGKYGAQVQTLLRKVKGLSIDTICPLHGPLLLENLDYHIGLYDTWSAYRPESKGVFVAYASIHGGTEVVAKRVAKMLSDKGVKVAITDLTRDDQAEAVEDAFRYDRMVLAAASYDGGLFTPMYNFIHRLQSKMYQQRKVALIENGSWAPSAGRVMKEMLASMKQIEIVEPIVTIRSRMHQQDIPDIEALVEEML